MVSREDMLGLRERILEGVEGIEDVEEKEYAGYDSLNFVGKTIGDEWAEVGLLLPGWSGEEGRRRFVRGKVLWTPGDSGEEGGTSN